MGLPNYRGHVDKAWGKWQDAARHAHSGDARTEEFIRLLASFLHYEVDARVGLNGKRGNPRDISDDVVNFRDPQDPIGVSWDPTADNIPVAVVDVIASAGSPAAHPSWGEVQGAAAAWVKPERIHDRGGGGEGPPPPAPPPSTPPTDITPLLAALNAISAQLGEIIAQQRQANDRLAAIEDRANRTALVAENIVAEGSWLAGLYVKLDEIRKAVNENGGSKWPW